MRKNLSVFYKILLSVIFVSFSITTFTSCAILEHQLNLITIKNDYNNCISNAQLDEDKVNCENALAKALEEENKRYEKKIKEESQDFDQRKDAYEYQKQLLACWGYSQSEAKTIARKFRKEHKNIKKYRFNADKCIKELTSIYISKDGEGKTSNQESENYEKIRNKTAVQDLRKELTKYGLSPDLAEKCIDKYYTRRVYSYRGDPSWDGNKIEDYMDYNDCHVIISKSTLEYLGFIKENSVTFTENNISVNTNTSVTEQSKPITTLKTNNDQHISSYELEVNKISQISVSGYVINNVNLTSEQENELKEIIEFLKKYPNTKIIVIGHTCSIGSEEINNLVGLRRAYQAKLYMVEQGIDEKRIEEVSKGATEPCSNNDTENGRSQNRRITFLVK